jgi:predicted flap endonuclease-1-like 5' DNA nuclease
MTSRAQLRKTALSLPGSAEDAGDDLIGFTVHGTPFASLSGDDVVHLHLPAADADAFRTAYPAAVTSADGTRVALADVDGQQLNHWVRRAWLAHAPRSLAARAAAADTVAAGAGGDLPKAIGGPATRGLANAGITTLAQIAPMSDTDLLALHGVGPKAVRLLREALTAAP